MGKSDAYYITISNFLRVLLSSFAFYGPPRRCTAGIVNVINEEEKSYPCRQSWASGHITILFGKRMGPGVPCF